MFAVYRFIELPSEAVFTGDQSGGPPEGFLTSVFCFQPVSGCASAVLLLRNWGAFPCFFELTINLMCCCYQSDPQPIIHHFFAVYLSTKSKLQHFTKKSSALLIFVLIIKLNFTQTITFFISYYSFTLSYIDTDRYFNCEDNKFNHLIS